jgi:hypothetical protein
MMNSPKIAIVKFKNNILIDSVTIVVDCVDAIEQSFHSIMLEEVTSLVIIFDGRGKWDVSLPMSNDVVKKKAKNIYRNID